MVIYRKMEEGYKIVVESKETEEGFLIEKYATILLLHNEKLTSNRHINGFTGYGLYDIEVIKELKEVKETYPILEDNFRIGIQNQKLTIVSQPGFMVNPKIIFNSI